MVGEGERNMGEEAREVMVYREVGMWEVRYRHDLYGMYLAVIWYSKGH